MLWFSGKSDNFYIIQSCLVSSNNPSCQPWSTKHQHQIIRTALSPALDNLLRFKILLIWKKEDINFTFQKNIFKILLQQYLSCNYQEKCELQRAGLNYRVMDKLGLFSCFVFYRLEIAGVESSHQNPVLENTRDFNSTADSREGWLQKIKGQI